MNLRFLFPRQFLREKIETFEIKKKCRRWSSLVKVVSFGQFQGEIINVRLIFYYESFRGIDLKVP